MLRIVLDTNVVLDLFHWANVDVVPIMAALEAGRIECLADQRTLDELQRVLTYPQLKLTPEMIAERWARYCALVKLVADGEAPPLPRCKDRDDQKFLELAARANADILVSKDKALLKLRGRTKLAFQIVKPAAMALRLAQ
ncbi:MAG: putative toxin-antitoxin system toxin component, PIN family [Rhodocyclaceae bacterium]|nr:MAG: putative toxin-antitoxin system toxin component, PIN family [Rhodocyclaceae bacterium]